MHRYVDDTLALFHELRKLAAFDAKGASTSALSDFPSNRFVVFASSATLLLLTQFLVCCIDRLNPP